MKQVSNLISFSIFAASTSFSAFATDIHPYDAKEFKKAETSGKTVVLAFHKKGCPACAVQEPNLEAALKSKDLNQVEAFRIEFDASSEIAKRFHVIKQTKVRLKL